MVAAKAPKNVHFSSSGNLSYRVAACVAQKNSGHKYLVSVNRSLGLSPGFFTERLAKLRDSQRIKQRAVANSHKFKKKKTSKEIDEVQKKCKLRGERRDFIPVRMFLSGSPIHRYSEDTSTSITT